MSKLVAIIAKSNTVLNFIFKFRVRFDRFYMVGVEFDRFTNLYGISDHAVLARIIITLKKGCMSSKKEVMPFCLR